MRRKQTREEDKEGRVEEAGKGDNVQQKQNKIKRRSKYIRVEGEERKINTIKKRRRIRRKAEK
jgi:hypothetical protein